MKISRAELIAQSLVLIEQGGVERLSMRALAGRLGVRQSALYWHVRNKDELLGRIIASLYRQALDAVPDKADWREWLIDFAYAYRAVLRSHREAAKVALQVKPVFDDADEAAEAFMSRLTERGVSHELALTFEASVISLVVGWMVIEQNEALHARLSNLIVEEQAFETGLRAMVAGFPDSDR